MSNAYADERLDFYHELRRDERVQKKGAEQRIRDLVDDIILYHTHTNQALYLLNRHYRENLVVTTENNGVLVRNAGGNGSGSVQVLIQVNKGDGSPAMTEEEGADLASIIEAGLKEYQSPIRLDFRDVRSIAYHAVMGYESDNLFHRMVGKVCPMLPHACEQAAHYNLFRKTGDVVPEFFENDIRDALHTLCYAGSRDEVGPDTIDRIHTKGLEYLERMVSMKRLNEAKPAILTMYSAESKENLKRLWYENDWSGFTSNWRSERLADARIGRIKTLFMRQAFVHEHRYRTLSLLSLAAKNVEDPVGQTSKILDRRLERLDSSRAIGSLFT